MEMGGIMVFYSAAQSHHLLEWGPSGRLLGFVVFLVLNDASLIQTMVDFQVSS